MINKSNMNKLAAVLVSCFAVVGCSSSSGGGSSSGGSSGSNGDVSSLQIVAPKTIFSKPAESSPGYIVIKNPTDAAVNNLNYSLANLVGGAKGTIIDPDSAASCATMPAHGQCNVKVMLPAGAVAGSFGFSANNDSSLLSKLGKVFKDSVTKTSNLTIGIQQAAYNNLSGADGITLSYYHTVINGVPYILVTGLVASANAGSFNNIVLVDNNGNAIPGQSLIGSSSGYTQGTTFQVLLPVPAGGGITQTIKVQTQQVSNGQTKVVSTSTSSSTLTTTEAGAKVGIVDMLPDAIYLTKDNPEQMITFSNSGDAAAQLQSLVASNPNLEVIFSQGSLGSGETTIATIKMKDPSKPATSGGLIFTYNNGQQEVKDSVVVEENVNPAPTPGPSPTPTPTPPSPPAPAAGLTATLSPNNEFFTTTAVGWVSNQMTITNTGNTTENNIVLTLPTGFSISPGSDLAKTCTIGTSPATISNDLAANTGSCDVTVTYTNSAVTSPDTGLISITYDYNNGTAAPDPTTAAVNYKVTQSTANLTASPSSVTFANVLNNGVANDQQTITVTNSGQVSATDLDFSSITGTDSTLFRLAGGTCSSGGSLSNDPNSNSCTIIYQFGPAASTVSSGNKTADNLISYSPYSGAPNPTNLTVGLTGHIVTARSADISHGTPSGTGFAGGDGTTSQNAYQIQQNTSSKPTITYTITNSGQVPATGFYLSGTASNYSLSGCGTSDNKITLAAGGTCDVTFTPTSLANVGALNLALSGISMNWIDEDSPNGDTKAMSGTAYVNVYAPATIAITPDTTQAPTSVEQDGTLKITATLSGGYNVPEQTIHATTTNTDTTFSNSGNCTITSPATSCDITATIAANATVASGQTIDITNSTNPSAAATPTPGTIQYNITQNVTKYVFVTSGTYNGNLKAAGGNASTGLDGANNICNILASSPGSVYETKYNSGARWKALLAGNDAANTTTGLKFKTYISGTGDTLLCTNSGIANCIWQNTANATLTAPLRYDEAGSAISATFYLWTGAGPNNISYNNSTQVGVWSNYSSTPDRNTCLGWSSANGANGAVVGQPYHEITGQMLKPWSANAGSPGYNSGYLVSSAINCDSGSIAHLLCIQQ